MGVALGVIFVVVFAGVLLVAPAAICWLKGKRWWATLGLVTMWHWVPAVRLAKPASWWARKYYAGDKLARSHARFP